MKQLWWWLGLYALGIMMYFGSGYVGSDYMLVTVPLGVGVAIAYTAIYPVRDSDDREIRRHRR